MALIMGSAECFRLNRDIQEGPLLFASWQHRLFRQQMYAGALCAEGLRLRAKTVGDSLLGFQLAPPHSIRQRVQMSLPSSSS